MAARFVENRAGIAAAARTPQMQAAMRRKAQQVQNRAQHIAPVDTGRYKSSFRTTSGVTGGRAYGRVSNAVRDPRSGAPYAVFLEFGTSRMRKQRILGRALDAVRD